MKLLTDLFTFAQEHEAVMTVISAWCAREAIAAKPFIVWIWNSELGLTGIIRRFLFGKKALTVVPPIQTTIPPTLGGH